MVERADLLQHLLRTCKPLKSLGIEALGRYRLPVQPASPVEVLQTTQMMVNDSDPDTPSRTNSTVLEIRDLKQKGVAPLWPCPQEA